MTPEALKTAIQEALQAQFNAGTAIARMSMVFDGLHPASEPAPKPDEKESETPQTPSLSE